MIIQNKFTTKKGLGDIVQIFSDKLKPIYNFYNVPLHFHVSKYGT